MIIGKRTVFHLRIKQKRPQGENLGCNILLLIREADTNVSTVSPNSILSASKRIAQRDNFKSLLYSGNLNSFTPAINQGSTIGSKHRIVIMQ